MLKNLPIEDLKEGMTFSNSIVNKYGQVLISSGTQFQIRHLSLFRTWGIQFVSVTCNENNTPNEEVNSEIKELAVEQLKRRLLWEPQKEVELDMFNMAIIHLVKRLSNEQENNI